MYYIKNKYNVYEKTKNFFRDSYDSVFNSFEYIKRMNMNDDEGFDVYRKLKAKTEKMYAKHNRYIDFSFWRVSFNVIIQIAFQTRFKEWG